MLVLTRKANEKLMIGNDIVVTVLEIRGDRVRLGFQAPASTPVHRGEIWKRIQAEQASFTFTPSAGMTPCLHAECI